MRREIRDGIALAFLALCAIAVVLVLVFGSREPEVIETLSSGATSSRDESGE